jgi:cystathionine beta-lyase/cystathionine gamma-synthase
VVKKKKVCLKELVEEYDKKLRRKESEKEFKKWTMRKTQEQKLEKRLAKLEVQRVKTVFTSLPSSLTIILLIITAEPIRRLINSTFSKPA